MNNIRYITHAEIDRKQWDSLVAVAGNGLAYAWSWYLDHISPGWDALVMGNYEAVMPLTQRSKWGISYLYQPYFMQQGGIFATDPVEPYLVERFIGSIPSKFRLVQLHLNCDNSIITEKIPHRRRLTYVLDLNRPYEEIARGYSDDNHKNLRKARRNAITVTRDISIDQLIAFYRETYGAMNPGITTEHYDRLKQALTEGLKYGVTELWGINDEAGDLCCAAGFLVSHGKALYIIGAPNAKGRELRATHVVLDEFIRHHSGSPMLLDFEGSEIPAVAYFYRKFGPEARYFPQLNINRLPWPLNWLKR